jgi:hypothetical protein
LDHGTKARSQIEREEGGQHSSDGFEEPMTQIMPAPNGVNGIHKEMDNLHLNGTTTNGKGSIRGSKANQRKKLDRKQSSPMMPSFMVSAPGKVIVFGEHAVVHGKVRGPWQRVG